MRNIGDVVRMCAEKAGYFNGRDPAAIGNGLVVRICGLLVRWRVNQAIGGSDRRALLGIKQRAKLKPFQSLMRIDSRV